MVILQLSVGFIIRVLFHQTEHFLDYLKIQVLEDPIKQKFVQMELYDLNGGQMDPQEILLILQRARLVLALGIIMQQQELMVL